MRKSISAAVLAAAIAIPAYAGETPSPDGARVYFANLEDGATVDAGSTVVFGLSGMGVAPAGTDAENTGHHHLLINRPPFGEGADDAYSTENGLPADDNHKHFGKGQTETTLDLPPGQHTLQLVLGDLSHIPHDPPVVSEYITITLE
ncbi:MAG: DUF4399 domain-containing protein [Paracoccaceae bacterium]|nr:DUF4399 domain-containing protein [Paracoccaceae bacterium]